MTKDEAIEYFKDHLDLNCVKGKAREAESMAIQALEERKEGEWESFGKRAYKCSKCSRGIDIKEPFCPSCGRRMKNGW